jgi:hypothetical protein
MQRMRLRIYHYYGVTNLEMMQVHVRHLSRELECKGIGASM